MPQDECKCQNDISKLELIDQYAEHLAEEIADTIGTICPPMFDFFVERLMCRVVHMQVLAHDKTIVSPGDPSEKLLTQVQQRIFRLSGSAPAALKVVLDEARVREGDGNARH